MREIRPSIWFVMLCLCIGAALFFRHNIIENRKSPTADQRVVRHEIFHRVTPTTPSSPTMATLLSELNDASPVVRETAAAEIGKLGLEGFDAVPELKRLAGSDPDDEVRRASRMALFNIRGGQPSPWGVISGTPDL